MSGLDTNVLVRWLADDDARQSASARKLFEAASASQSTLYVPLTVVLELEWVLRSRYGHGKATVLTVFNALLETQELEFQSERALERALHLYRRSRADFADCLHAGSCGESGQAPMLTFDHQAARLPGVELVRA
jgi:predicted nucleic-acid-binding protein